MVKAPPERSSLHRKLNTALTIVVIVLGCYISIFPFLPQVSWWLQHRDSASVSKPITLSKTSRQPPIPDEKLLIIPRLDLRETIHDGPSSTELNKGAWLVPMTSTPDKQSNTVIVGHRFTYSGPATFYFLDKLQVADRILINWSRQEYTYKVISIKVVPPTDVSVEASTDTSRLTLYTCTPLWTAKNRLVVIAALEGVRL